MNLFKEMISSVRVLSQITQPFKNLTLKDAQVRNYAFKSDLKIKWVRPEKIPCFKPEKSGDLEPLPVPDLSQYRLDFQKSKELETANDLVKKLFTLEFAPREEIIKVYKKQMIDRVRRHKYDCNSMEMRIAGWTGQIRALQDLMERFPRNNSMKVILKELIDKRKKYLKFLRSYDYKCFEWLIENLNIVYRPPPEQFIRVTRKDSLRKLTQKYCDDIKEQRLEAYRLRLKAEQPAFLEEKIRILEFIKKEQEECGVEVTVTQEEIDETKRQLAEIKVSDVVENVD